MKTNNYVHGTPAVRDGIAYFAGCDEVFRAVRASDGKIVFEAPIGAYTGASVALDAGTAYFGTFDNEVLALDLKNTASNGATSILNGSSPSTRRRRSPLAK